jgi:hypothetical protein
LREPRRYVGQGRLVDHPLARQQPGHVRITEHRDAVGRERQRRGHGLADVARTLAQEPVVQQVEVDRRDAGGAQVGHGLSHHR